jgi:hypothetical protein
MGWQVEGRTLALVGVEALSSGQADCVPDELLPVLVRGALLLLAALARLSPLRWLPLGEAVSYTPSKTRDQEAGCQHIPAGWG